MTGSTSDSEKRSCSSTSGSGDVDLDLQEKGMVTTTTTSKVGYPDPGHEEVEELDPGHQLDLQLTQQHSIKAVPAISIAGADIHRSKSQTSTKSKLARIASSLKSKDKKKKDRLEKPKLLETNMDENIIGWDGQDDPKMPLNFSNTTKWYYLAITSASTLMVALASAMIAPGVSFVSKDYHNDSATLNTLIVTIFLLGLAIGPIFLSPLSEIYGRKIVLSGGNAFFVMWQLACALSPNLASMIIFRLLAGIGGSASLTIGGGIISDLFYVDERGTASAMYAMGTLTGPVLGPIMGGFIAERTNWHWVFWVLLIASGILLVVTIILTKETNHRVLIHRKVKKYKKDLPNPNLRSCYDDPTAEKQSETQVLLTSIRRPLHMLFGSPIVLILATYMAFVYGMQYLFSTTIPTVFQEVYNFNLEITGLAYIGLGVGFTTGALTVARINDATVIRLTRANNNVFEPEMRLPACVFFATFIPITFFWYGWTTYYHVHWIVPIIGLIPFGIAQVGIFVPIQTYVIDTYPAFAASGIAALTIMRSLLGTVLPLAGPRMYERLGLGWGNSVLAFVAVGLIPFPILIYRYGGLVRRRWPLVL